MYSGAFTAEWRFAKEIATFLETLERRGPPCDLHESDFSANSFALSAEGTLESLGIMESTHHSALSQ
jgi:hypothetical protein